MPDPLRTEALFQAAKIIADPESSRRDKLAATRFLLEADRNDLTVEKLDLDRAKFDHAAKTHATPVDDFVIDLAPYDPTR